jgi:hypothetical protein
MSNLQNPSKVEVAKTLKESGALKSPEDFVSSEAGKVVCEILCEQVNSALERNSISRKVFRKQRKTPEAYSEWQYGQDHRRGISIPVTGFTGFGKHATTSTLSLVLADLWKENSKIDILDAIYNRFVNRALRYDEKPVLELLESYTKPPLADRVEHRPIASILKDIRRDTDGSTAVINGHTVGAIFNSLDLLGQDWFDFHGKTSEAILTGELAVVKHLGQETKLFTDALRLGSERLFPVDFLRVTGHVGYFKSYPVQISTSSEDGIPTIHMTHSMEYELYPTHPSKDTMMVFRTA